MDKRKKEEIRKQAKEILKSFGRSLERIKVEKKALKKEVGGFRQEGNGDSGENDFRQRMFSNAPSKNDDFIIAEKKTW